MTIRNNKIIIEHRRWMILYILHASPSYSANSDIIHILLCDQGVPVDVEEIQQDLELLERRHCLNLDKFVLSPGNRLWVAKMTKIGKEVFDGIRQIYGVKQNGPLR